MKIVKEEATLMKLSLPRGWAIGDNKFYDVEPIATLEDDQTFIENWHQGFVEDVLWIFEWKSVKDGDGSKMIIPQSNHYSVDVSWFPDSRIVGEYTATLNWVGENGLVRVEQVSSKNRFAIRDKIESWLNDITENYAESHSKFQ